MVKITSDKKREYNKNYKKKQKQKEEITAIAPEPQIDEIAPRNDPLPQPQPQIDSPQDDEIFTIDRDTMNFLLECVQSKKEDVTVEKKEVIVEAKEEKSSNEPNFFFHMKQAIFQQLAVTVPLIALKLIVDGAKLSIPSNIQDIIKPSSQRVEKQSTLSELRVVSLE